MTAPADFAVEAAEVYENPQLVLLYCQICGSSAIQFPKSADSVALLDEIVTDALDHRKVCP